jgi:phage FluMu protein Com
MRTVATVTCRRCQKTITVASSVATRTKYCPRCRSIVKSARRKHRYQSDKMKSRMSTETFNSAVGGAYKITKDPDHSWVKDSSFTQDEIDRLLSMGYLSIGTEFCLAPSTLSTHRVISRQGHLTLKILSEPGVQPCPSTTASA